MKETGLGSSATGAATTGGSAMLVGGTAAGLIGIGVAGWLVLNRSEPEMVMEPEQVAIVEPAQTEAVKPEIEKAEIKKPAVEEPKVVIEQPKTVEPEPEVKAPVIVPSFDVVRVDKDRNALIAGNGEPDSAILLMGDGEVLAETTTDSAGGFVFLLDMPDTDKPIELSLEQAQSASIDSVLVMPTPQQPEAAPKIIVADAEKVVVVQDEKLEIGPDVVQDLSLDTINYSIDGNVVITGRGSTDQSVRVYVDNKPVSLGRVESGSWSFEIPEIKEGVYTLRVDAVDAAGDVTERVESPFQRVTPEQVEGAITIQPGFTLWQLAELKYGSGDRYIQIYEANKEIIKDPNMIFPGQVFDLPDN